MKTKAIIFSVLVAVATIIISFLSKEEMEFSVYNTISQKFDEAYIINNPKALTSNDFIYFITNNERKNYKILNYYESILNLNKYFNNKKCIFNFKGDDFLFATEFLEQNIDSFKKILLENSEIVKDLPFIKNNPIVFSSNGIFISNNKNLISETIKNNLKKPLTEDIKNIKKILSSKKTINYLNKDSLNNWRGYDINKVNDTIWQISFISKSIENNSNIKYTLPTYLTDSKSDSLKINDDFYQILSKSPKALIGKSIKINTSDSVKTSSEGLFLSPFFNSELILNDCIDFMFKIKDDQDIVFLNKRENITYFEQRIALNKSKLLHNIVIHLRKKFSFNLNPPTINYNKQWIVINHVSKNDEILNFNKKTKTLSLINNNDTLWVKTLSSNIVGNVIQIDAYKNNKLQYAFVNNDSLYIIDRNGSSIDNFPIKIEKPITGISVIDYEKNKNYRLFNSYKNGVENFDLNGQNTKGWIEQNSYLNNILPLQHFIINQKDYIVTINIKGDINLLNRKGEIRYGLNKPITNPENISAYKLIIDDKLETSSINIIYKDSTITNIKF